MIEKPNLPDHAICAALRAGYGITARALTFLPIGNDSTAWAYRVHASNGVDYFLKLKQGQAAQSLLRVPRWLYQSGIHQVVAPLPTLDQSLSQPARDFSLILYPFIEGRSGMDQGLSQPQWAAFGSLLRQIHSTALPAGLVAQMPRETFQPWWGPIVRQLQTKIAQERFTHPLEQELAAFWRARSAEIEQMVTRTEALGRRLQARQPAFCLCHADIHTANLLVDAQGQLFVVDWDQTLLAPPERDLMFVTGPHEAQFFSGYGPVEIRALPLAYYRCEWVVQEIGDYGQRVFLLPGLGGETRLDAVRGFFQLFEPGDVVEAAYHALQAVESDGASSG
jgi:spectinomycin phosphotransferase